MKQFSKYFDHTLLKPDASRSDILKLCSEAAKYDFASVCVNGCHVAAACAALKSTDVKTAAVAGFPLGAMSTEAKAAEISDALENGASEIDAVINIGALKESRYEYIEDELATLAAICHEDGSLLKVILETCLLTDEEIVKGCQLAVKAGADFVKTSTGFSTGGATPRHVALMKKTVGDDALVKASGGIRILEDAKEMIEAGADRLGCSASVHIIEEHLTQSSRS